MNLHIRQRKATFLICVTPAVRIIFNSRGKFTLEERKITFADRPNQKAEGKFVFADRPFQFAEVKIVSADRPNQKAEGKFVFAEGKLTFANRPNQKAEVKFVFADRPFQFAEVKIVSADRPNQKAEVKFVFAKGKLTFAYRPNQKAACSASGSILSRKYLTGSILNALIIKQNQIRTKLIISLPSRVGHGKTRSSTCVNAILFKITAKKFIMLCL